MYQFYIILDTLTVTFQGLSRSSVMVVLDSHIYLVGPQIPKFDTATQAILKFDTAAHHNLKIDMRNAIEATLDTIPYYLRQTTLA